MKPRLFCLAVAGAMLLMPTPAAARTIAFDTDEVTEAAVAISPDGSTFVFTMLGHLFRAAGHGMSVTEITRGVTHGFATIEHTVFPLRVHDDVIRMLAGSDTRWDPTLAVVGGDSQLLRKDPARLSDPKLLAVTPEWAIETAKSSAGYEKDLTDVELKRSSEAQLASIREAHARGVKFAIGTDAPNPLCFFGASLHWEMEFSDAAKLVGASDLGVIAPTKRADLVLLDANPLDDIKNTQSIWRTVKGGRVFDPLTMQASN